MLAGPNADEMGNHGTWLAAVFGRGRVLGAWGARDFGDEQIDEICLFLLGACSCQVKQQNPGWDLLLDADWDTALQEMGTPALALAAGATRPVGEGGTPSTPASEASAPGAAAPELRPPAAAPAAAVETVTISANDTAPASAAQAPSHTQATPLAGLAGALLVLGGGLAWWSMRKRA
jgi:hypothetical protein